jgi:phosphatidylglycerol:prolipoprotein diacylglycerol transferase
VWLSMEFFLRLSESANLSLQHFREHGFWYIISFLFFGRMFAMIAEYKQYLREPMRMLVFWDGGFSFLGGAIGIGIVLSIVTKGHRTTFLQWLDALVPAATLGLVFDWMGAFLAGDAYGSPTDAFWGVTYDAVNVRYAIPIHPVQLYYAFFYMFLTFVLLVIRKRSRRVGAETLFGIIAACLATMWFEFYRGDFSIPVFATKVDFILLFALFLSLGVFVAIEVSISRRIFLAYQSILVLITGGYFFARPWLELETYELRVSQLLAILALLASAVYVVVQRRKYPYF